MRKNELKWWIALWSTTTMLPSLVVSFELLFYTQTDDINRRKKRKKKLRLRPARLCVLFLMGRCGVPFDRWLASRKSHWPSQKWPVFIQSLFATLPDKNKNNDTIKSCCRFFWYRRLIDWLIAVSGRVCGSDKENNSPCPSARLDGLYFLTDWAKSIAGPSFRSIELGLVGLPSQLWWNSAFCLVKWSTLLSSWCCPLWTAKDSSADKLV